MRQRRISDTIKLNTGSLYAVIDNLLKNNLIQPTERSGKESIPNERFTAGKEELFDWLRSLLRAPGKEYPQFAAGLSFVSHLKPQEVIDLLEEGLERWTSRFWMPLLRWKLS